MPGFEALLFRLSLEVIRDYDFSVPLHRWLATWFRANKKLGSRDRRGIRELVYSYYRLGKCLRDEPAEVRMQVALYLTAEKPAGLTDEILKTSPLKFTGELSLSERIGMVKMHYPAFDERDLFPFNAALSKGVAEEFLRRSALKQPLVWIRVRSNAMQQVLKDLEQHNIPVSEEHSATSIAVPQTVNLEALQTFQEGLFEVQDLASQHTVNLFDVKAGEKWWDCCAASGGKSLLLMESCRDINLTVSDIRKSSLVNLAARFDRNRYKQPESFPADLTLGTVSNLQNRVFDGILVDAPCSGSGTWSRTPEMLSSFNESQLAVLQQVQKTIALNASCYLAKGGKLVYITCSVFAAENEEVVAALIQSGQFRLEEERIFQEAQNAADTLYVARLIKV